MPFIIYDAAAGSGKTFTLVKDYLKLILLNTNEGYYKYILAITFTNKAVAEMKQRIINSLSSFANEDILTSPPDMATQIAEETGLSLNQIQEQSKIVLKHLLHNYSKFSVETIDSFNHRLIRTFSRELKLTGNFEVSLDIPKLINEAVDLLISKAGENSKTTQVLIDFALEKTDDDKSWDISRDIIKTAGLLFNENDTLHINKLKEKSLDDFLDFRKELKKKRAALSNDLKKIAAETLQLIEESGLQFVDFSGSYYPKFMDKIVAGDFNLNLSAKWQEQLGEKPLYPGRVLKDSPEAAATLDELEPTFTINFEKIKTGIPKLLLFESMLKNSIPLSVINLVNQEIEHIKEEQNMLPISEFNQLINNEIKSQPAPFIYERLGERYRHFFIDEFQDTSLLQWQNLIPLIENSVSQQFEDGAQGSLLLVGDAKQSIYRWRGGLPEQFIELCNGENPFYIENKVEHLPTNYRSCKELIDFNNSFFTFISNYFGNPLHKKIYESGNHQKSTKKEGGYIKLEFLDYQNAEESHEIYAEKALQTIISLKDSGCQEKDICILTRTKIQGISLGSYLIEQGITIVSSETLLLQHSPIVRFLVDCLTISLFPENEEVKISLLEYLYDYKSVAEEKHSFFKSLIKTSLSQFSSYLDVDFQKIQSVSLYDSIEFYIREFKLDKNADAYLFAFMDLVYEFEQQAKGGKISFLEYWDAQKEKAGIPISDGVDGVKLMTIHKAKGLEFPIVIFPYADINIYNEIDAKAWFPIDGNEFDFDETLINFNKNVETFGKEGKAIYDERRNTLELDAINLLYVTLTRAETQLYIFSKKPSKITDRLTTFNQLFGEFLKDTGYWEEDKDSYEFGSAQRIVSEKKAAEITPIEPTFTTTSLQDYSLNPVVKEVLMWEPENEEKNFGLLFHKVMENVKHQEDIAIEFKNIDDDSTISDEIKQLLKKGLTSISNHPKLIHLFDTSEDVENERKIILPKNEVDNLIADRINFHKNGMVSLIDYKTGKQKEAHKEKINLYGLALNEMGYDISEKILIYTKFDPIKLIYV